MDFSYADFLIHQYSSFSDPFSQTLLPTERLCYPIFYANEDFLSGLELKGQLKDIEDVVLTRDSYFKDLPAFEKSAQIQCFIPDGAAHILKSLQTEPMIQLLGMPKIGKSSLLRKIVLLSAYALKKDPNSYTPLLVTSEVFRQTPISTSLKNLKRFLEESFMRENSFC
jgi:hypothetical protein